MNDLPVPSLLIDPPGLWERAKCRTITITKDYDPFFDEEDPQPAIDFCNGTDDGAQCPERHNCLIFALVNNCREGVWGGTEPLTRRAIRKRWPVRTRNRKHPVHPEWKWMDPDSALAGMDAERLRRELADGTA